MHNRQYERIADSLLRRRGGDRELSIHVFDVDKVIFNQHLTTNLVLEVAEQLPERYEVFDSLRFVRDQAYSGRMPLATLHSLALQYVEHGFFRGLPREVVCAIAKRLGEGLLVSTNNFPLEILENLRVLADRQGDVMVIAITGAPEEIVLPFCSRLGFDGVVSSVYECGDDGKYTLGRNLHAAYHKGRIMDELAEIFGIRWNGSIGMGNSMRDLGILDRVKYPFAINPDMDLLEVVRDNPRIVYVEDNGERGARLFRADGQRRFCEVAYCETLPPDVARLIMLIPGALTCQGNCMAH